MAPLSVLLVGNNPGYLRLATHFLQKRDDVLVFGSQYDNFQHSVSDCIVRPDVIFLNLSRAVEEGLVSIRNVRDRLSDVKIIVLAQWDAESHRQAALAAGADEFISKTNIDVDDLPKIWQKLTSIQSRRSLHKKIKIIFKEK